MHFDGLSDQHHNSIEPQHEEPQDFVNIRLQRSSFCERVENVGLQQDGSRPRTGWSKQEMESASHKPEYLYSATTDRPLDLPDR